MKTTTKFWSYVTVTPACWLWRGQKTKGYGRFSGASAHRLAYEDARGAIPDGLELDHLCRNPLCVNPDHLEPVTRIENMRRRYADYSQCAQGHSYTPENTYIRPSGHRDCRACIRRRVKAYSERRKSA